jgi:hypothetical protein
MNLRDEIRLKACVMSQNQDDELETIDPYQRARGVFIFIWASLSMSGGLW